MKKAILLALTATMAFGGFAQTVIGTNNPTTLTSKAITSAAKDGKKVLSHNFTTANTFATGTANKGTGHTDPTPYYLLPSAYLFDTSIAYTYDAVAPKDTGYVFGTNITARKAYADYYSFGFMPDTTMQILGAISLWHGTVSPTSTHTVNFKVWNVDTNRRAAGTNTYLVDLPGSTVLGSQTMPVTGLGIGNNGIDTIITTMFTNAINIDQPFYFGYDFNYPSNQYAGDTFAVRTSYNNVSLTAGMYAISGTDTLLYGQSCTQDSAGTWGDNYWNFGFFLNYSMVPVVQISSANIFTTGVNGVTRENLTFYGVYPNPAVENTNIKFSLKNNTKVDLQVLDMNGRVLNTINSSEMNAGEHTMAVPTSALAAGNYLLLLRTSAGGAMATQLTIIK